MSWSIGYDSNWKRDVGYGVPAYCDHPKCSAEINRGLACVCGGEAYGGDRGCGLFFCTAHLSIDNLCPRCAAYRSTPYKHPKPEHPRWMAHVLNDDSWALWRVANPEIVARYQVETAP